jgi:CDP-paratose synthetase
MRAKIIKWKTQNPKLSTILLTGATGFLGSHILEALLASEYHVVILKRSFSDTWRIAHLLDRIKAYDIDKEPLEQVFEKNRIDVVIHTATHYGRNNGPVCKVVETNLLFPLHLLETAVQFNTDTFFNSDTLLYKYLNYYALSKKQFVEWLRIFSEEKKIKGVNLKIEHMYGSKDDPTKFVPWLVQQLNANAERIPLTKGEQKRDFIYVSDVVSAFLLLLDKRQYLAGFSELEVGSGSAVRLKDFVLGLKEALTQIKGHELQTILDFGALPYRHGEPMEIKADISRLQSMGWQPEHGHEHGIYKMLSEEMS